MPAHTAYLHNFFNDSYEVYEADWTPGFFDHFLQHRGYNWRHLKAFIDRRYRRNCRFGGRLPRNVVGTFTGQLHPPVDRLGAQSRSKTRNQAHGSPQTSSILYVTGVPECEGFGLSNFGIKGLRTDPLTRKNFSHLSMPKYASSKHIAGKTYSSETFYRPTPTFDLAVAMQTRHGSNVCSRHQPHELPRNDLLAKRSRMAGMELYASIICRPPTPFGAMHRD